MRYSRAAHLTILTLVLGTSGCHLQHPGEYTPRMPAACAPARVASLEERWAQLGEAERELLRYCRQAETAESARALESHANFIVDLSLLGLVVGTVAVLVSGL